MIKQWTTREIHRGQIARWRGYHRAKAGDDEEVIAGLNEPRWSCNQATIHRTKMRAMAQRSSLRSE